MTSENGERRHRGNVTTHRYVWDRGELPSTCITLAVADVLDRDVDNLQPLGETLDASALDTLLESANGAIDIEFRYADCLVTIGHGTEITVTSTA